MDMRQITRSKVSFSADIRNNASGSATQVKQYFITIIKRFPCAACVVKTYNRMKGVKCNFLTRSLLEHPRCKLFYLYNLLTMGKVYPTSRPIIIVGMHDRSNMLITAQYPIIGSCLSI